MKTTNRYFKKISAIAIVVLLGCLCVSVQAHAVGVVSGRYISRTASEITLEIKVGSPAPASLIIIQYLPPGTAPAAAEPPYKKYNAAKGEVRWLLRRIAPGTQTVRLKLSSPVAPDHLRAEIRCKDPVTGKLITTQVP